MKLRKVNYLLSMNNCLICNSTMDLFIAINSKIITDIYLIVYIQFHIVLLFKYISTRLLIFLFFFFLGGVLPKPISALTPPTLQKSSSTSSLSVTLPSNQERKRSLQQQHQHRRQQQQQQTASLNITTVRFVTPNGHTFKINPR